MLKLFLALFLLCGTTASANQYKSQKVDLARVRRHALSQIRTHICESFLTEAGVFFWERGTVNEKTKIARDESHLLFLVKPHPSMKLDSSWWLGYRYNFDGTEEPVIVQSGDSLEKPERFNYPDPRRGNAYFGRGYSFAVVHWLITKKLAYRFPYAKFELDTTMRRIRYEAPDYIMGLAIYKALKEEPLMGSIVVSALTLGDTKINPNPVNLGTGHASEVVDVAALRERLNLYLSLGYRLDPEPTVPSQLVIRKGKSKY
jgi:hypothetical protein